MGMRRILENQKIRRWNQQQEYDPDQLSSSSKKPLIPSKKELRQRKLNAEIEKETAKLIKEDKAETKKYSLGDEKENAR